ncbi:MAG: cytochrome c oxidase assembly factor Coa1 family protein [Bacteroidota bacterium]
MSRLRNGIAALLALAAFMSTAWVGCSAFLKNNDAYERGLQAALSDPTVQDALGAPVQESWFLNGAIESGGAYAQGSWTTRIRGTERSGTLNIQGGAHGGQWGVIDMTLTAGDEEYVYVPKQGFMPVSLEGAPGFDILSE